MAVRAGKMRPSQIVSQFGPGALIDLPTLSMVVTGIEDWDISNARRVDEPRLARKLGVSFFHRPPFYHTQRKNWWAASSSLSSIHGLSPMQSSRPAYGVQVPSPAQSGVCVHSGTPRRARPPGVPS